MKNPNYVIILRGNAGEDNQNHKIEIDPETYDFITSKIHENYVSFENIYGDKYFLPIKSILFIRKNRR
ncbi:MAG: hypothetical protein ACRDCH_00095 [Metamycoplasmataceae bacterium]